LPRVIYVNRRILYVLVAAIVFVVLVASPLLVGRMASKKPVLTYSVGGCLIKSPGEITRGQKLKSEVEVYVEDSSIKLLHHLSYVCCADMVVNLQAIEKHGNYTLLRIMEKNVGEICRCICDYEIEIRVSNLTPGCYRLEIYGVEFKDTPAEKLWEGLIEL